MISAAAARGVLHYAEQACNHYIAFRLLAIIRHKVFSALRKLAPAKLEEKGKGELISVITSDIELPKNKIIGIRSRSGSGKSTMLKLLMRFWKTIQGSVQISDRDVNTLNTENLRQIEGFVIQETCIFHDTIVANIAVGKQDAKMEEIIKAAKKASIHNFISSPPNGYETLVSEMGAVFPVEKDCVLELPGHFCTMHHFCYLMSRLVI